MKSFKFFFLTCFLYDGKGSAQDRHASVLGCHKLGQCSGHGKCRHSHGECICDDGWGSPSDVEVIGFRPSHNCSLRVCYPFGKAWADVPSSETMAHSALAECSGGGKCNRITGVCNCFAGFRGKNCEFRTCPTSSGDSLPCSGHGRCISLKNMAKMDGGLPLSASSSYEGDSDGSTWDEDRIFSCHCDSSWSVGLQSGETQESEWFGADCSQRRCPSGDNPDTAVNETDCSGVLAKGGRGTGAVGNLCHFSCSGKGICDYTTGVCQCLESHYGPACENRHSRT